LMLGLFLPRFLSKAKSNCIFNLNLSIYSKDLLHSVDV
jgi:hypothetical protein